MSQTRAPEAIRSHVLEALRAVIDPEIGVNIVDLGLVYGIDVDARNVHVSLTLTSPACPLGEQVVRDAEDRLHGVEGLAEVHVELVWQPAWTPERMSPYAKDILGWRRG
jgi:metal-sulfur cluster biosynthetic enzyme